MNLREVANEYIYGQQCRKEASLINRHQIAAKFERSTKCIARIVSGANPEGVPADECELIRQVEAEQRRLLQEAAKRTQHVLSNQYNFTRYQIDLQLSLMGYVRESKSA